MAFFVFNYMTIFILICNHFFILLTSFLLFYLFLLFNFILIFKLFKYLIFYSLYSLFLAKILFLHVKIIQNIFSVFVLPFVHSCVY